MGPRLAVALDLSQDDPDHLLRRAIPYARAANATLDLVYVGTGRAARDQLEALRALVPEALRGDARLLPGDVVDTLVAITGEVDAMVVGPREPLGLERWLHGPVAVRVLRKTQCPIVIPKTDRFGDRPPRMLMGIDVHGDRRDATLKLAGAFAEQWGATLDLLYTLPGSLPPVRRAALRDAVISAWLKGHEEEQAKVDALLATLPPHARGAASIDPGEPEDVLVQRSHDYDLVVVGNRNRAGLGGLVLGPVAASVVPRADSDILVLPTASLGD